MDYTEVRKEVKKCLNNRLYSGSDILEQVRRSLQYGGSKHLKLHTYDMVSIIQEEILLARAKV